ncbi:immunity 52 family protein [Hyalangium rubrum]|uniref:Immunity 52 family protein n=1 Tax=Hyalangium rubrum TaxID=3103134 RepID=A0ABU5HHX4_9BACT|nr:immunity 52 family protein [Hyalangium sp. s54d21]MDY7232749.1 immunity 52 family protein [Hyalangium sp. s54d21]
MNETYYAGAYWGPRQENAEACARRAQRFFQALARHDAFFARWFLPPRSRGQVPRPLETDLPTLQETFEQNRIRNDTGGVIQDLGFQVTADNGMQPGKQQRDHAYLRFLCGAYIDPVGNSCVLNLPATGPLVDRVLTGPVLGEVLRAMALGWEPDWAIATSHEHREQTAQRASAGTFVGWVMYFSQRRGPVPPLPSPVRVEPVEGLGTLVTLTPERFTVSSPSHVELAAHVHQALERAGLLVPVTPRGKPG